MAVCFVSLLPSTEHRAGEVVSGVGLCCLHGWVMLIKVDSYVLIYWLFFETNLNDSIFSVLYGDRYTCYKQVMLRALEYYGLVHRHIDS